MINIFDVPGPLVSLVFPYCQIQDWKLEKKSSDIFVPNNSGDVSGGTGSATETFADEEAPLNPSARLSYLGRTQLGNHAA